MARPSYLGSGPKHDAAMLLYRAGWRDAQIAPAMSVCTATVGKWRRTNGLTPHRTFKIDQARCMELYRSGANDHVIATEFGVNDSAICRWRQRRDLPSNIPQFRLDASQKRKARALLRRGASRRQVADALGIESKTSIQKVRDAMRDREGLRQTGHTVVADRRRALRQNPECLLQRISTAIGTRVAPDIAADATNEIYLAILEGLLPVEEIEARAHQMLGQTIGRFASKFGPLSLDEPNADGLCLVDCLADDRAEAEMEAAGDLALR